MFHFNQNFETIASFQNLKPGCYELPTTTHNSPGSLKTSSLKLEDSPLNCSFDEGNQSTHASAIWDASVKYLQASLKDFVNTFTGFNDEAISSNENLSPMIFQKSIQEMIHENTLLKSHQKYQFIGDLDNQFELKNLLRELSNKFNEPIFNQLAYVVFKIWQKKNQNQNILKNNQQKEDSYTIPHFDCFWGDQEQEEQGFSQKKLARFSWAPIFQASNMQDILIFADKCCDQIAEEIFYEKKIKFLNLKEVQTNCDQFQTVMNFNQFFRTLTRSIYLSVQGFFAQPKEQCQTQMIEQFIDIEQFDFDFNQISDFEKQEQNSNKRFIRSYDQVFQDDDEDFEICSVPTKKRKLQ